MLCGVFLKEGGKKKRHIFLISPCSEKILVKDELIETSIWTSSQGEILVVCSVLVGNLETDQGLWVPGLEFAELSRFFSLLPCIG